MGKALDFLLPWDSQPQGDIRPATDLSIRPEFLWVGSNPAVDFVSGRQWTRGTLLTDDVNSFGRGVAVGNTSTGFSRGGGATTHASMTIVAVLVRTAAAYNYSGYFISSGTNAGVSLASTSISATDICWTVRGKYSTTGVALPLNEPVVLVASITTDSPTRFYLKIRNLVTGVVTSTAGSSGAAFTAGDGTYKVGRGWDNAGPVSLGLMFGSLDYLPEESLGRYLAAPWLVLDRQTIWIPASAGGAASTLAAATGTFALTGIATGILASRRLTAATASFAQTGNDAGLTAGRKVTAAAASYALTGTATGLLSGRRVTADAASYALTGIATTLKAARLLSAAAASFTLTGNAAALTYTAAGSYSLAAETGSFALTATGLRAGRKLTAGTGIFAFTGNVAGLLRGYTLAATAQAYALTGNAAGLLAGRQLTAAAGAYVLTGNAAALTYSQAGAYSLTAAAGAFVLTGVAATLTYSGPIVYGSLAGSTRKPGATRRNVQTAARSSKQNATR